MNHFFLLSFNAHFAILLRTWTVRAGRSSGIIITQLIRYAMYITLYSTQRYAGINYCIHYEGKNLYMYMYTCARSRRNESLCSALYSTFLIKVSWLWSLIFFSFRSRSSRRKRSFIRQCCIQLTLELCSFLFSVIAYTNLLFDGKSTG